MLNKLKGAMDMYTAGLEDIDSTITTLSLILEFSDYHINDIKSCNLDELDILEQTVTNNVRDIKDIISSAKHLKTKMNTFLWNIKRYKSDIKRGKVK